MGRRTFIKAGFSLLGAACLEPVAKIGRAVAKNPVESPIESPLTMAQYLSFYTRAALENTSKLPDGRLAIVPSPVYANGIYGRDSFYAALGLGDAKLIEGCYRWFEETQNQETGQIASAVAFSPEDQSLEPKDDETTLLYLPWSALIQRQGRPINPDSIAKAFEFVQSHVRDGFYVSQPGPFRYWADTLVVQRPDVISYNQGLYTVALESLRQIGLENITSQMVQSAKDNYQSLYKPWLGFVSQSRDVSVQDLSVLFPESLHRHLFNKGILPDDVISRTVNHHLETAGVYFRSGKLAGLKITAGADGGFLPPERFSVPDLAAPGDYQNGGYWPLWTLSELALAYEVSGDGKYKSAIAELLETELGKDGQSKEFMRLTHDNLGDFDSFRSPYSWNVLFVPFAKRAGL